MTIEVCRTGGSGTKEQVDADLKDKVLLDFDPV